jgi:hypothetical protein
MTLADWCDQQGRGEKKRLSDATGLGQNVILYLAAGKRAATYRVAKLVSAATGGKVSIEELCDPHGARKRARAAKRKATTSRRTRRRTPVAA